MEKALEKAVDSGYKYNPFRTGNEKILLVVHQN